MYFLIFEKLLDINVSKYMVSHVLIMWLMVLLFSHNLLYIFDSIQIVIENFLIVFGFGKFFKLIIFVRFGFKPCSVLYDLRK